MQSSAQQSKIVAGQYLAQERLSQEKSEFINGQVFAMAGASRSHNQITFNIAGELRAQFQGRPCVGFVNDMRVKVSRTGLYTYPDVVATCEPPEFEDDHADTLLNPKVIIEVLSDSTEAYDRGEKFAHYRRLDSLTDYVLIAQHQCCVEHFLRQNIDWRYSAITQLNAAVQLESIGCEMALREIYDKVIFFRPKSARQPILLDSQ